MKFRLFNENMILYKELCSQDYERVITLNEFSEYRTSKTIEKK